MVPYVFLAIAVLITTIFIIVDYKGEPKKALMMKTLASIGFVSVAISAFIYGNGDGEYFKFILCGLILGLIGDVALALRAVYEEKKDKYFIIGLGAFLLGHIAYSIEFAKISSITLIEIIIAAIIVTLFVIFGKLVKLQYGNMKPFVIGYMCVISIMVVKAVSIAITIGISEANMLIAVGAVLFAISDMILAFIYFWNRKVKVLSPLNLITYYGGQLLIALSILFR